ncbi:MAG: hypothetical protein LBT79_00970 [Elusimicrobiota bacterium]|jgi:putative addiction module killer protein|nr:hypothetical protein [Elusimicrobiota bacterium]
MIIIEALPIYKKWKEQQTKEIKNIVTDAVNKIKVGNTAKLKTLRAAIIEIKIDFGAGVRIYLTKKQENHYIALWGGADKKRQQSDIEKAIKIKQFWEANENEKKKNNGNGF